MNVIARHRSHFPGSFAAGLVAGLILLLSACAAVVVTGPGVGMSRSAAAKMARIRADHGLPTLVPDAELEQAALQQAGYMANARNMTHTTGLGRDFATRMRKAGIHGFREENIAYGRFDLDRVLEVWMNSPPHRRNMLNPAVRRYGLAYVDDGRKDGRRYWALVLDN